MPVRTTAGQKLWLIAFGLALALLAVAALEGVLALLGWGDAERFADPFVGFEGSTPLFTLERSEESGSFYATAENKLEFFYPQRFPAEKVPGTYRVFTLGGSTTAGRPYDDRVSFSRWLERYLDAAEPGRRHEVVNAGAISYASYRVARLMQELVRYSPDLFVVYTGHNEFLEERTYRRIIDRNAAALWLDSRLSRLRLAALARRALGSDGGGESTRLQDEVVTRLDVWAGLQAYRRDDALQRSIVEHFAWNLERMAAIAHAHGVELIFVQPVSNLKDFSPFKSEHRPGLAAEDRRQFAALLGEGRSRLAAGDATEALELFDAARAIDADHAELHFRIGRALLARGDADAAREAFVRAKDLDVAPLRALESLVERVGETAERHGLGLIDLPALVAAESGLRSGVPIPGSELLLDHVHPDVEIHSLIAERLMEALAADGAVRLAGWSAGRRREIYEREMAGLDRRYYARRDLNLAKVLGWAGKLEEAEPPLRRSAEVLDGEPDLHLNLGILLQKTGRLDEAARELERVVEVAPGAALPHFNPGSVYSNLGVVYGRLGRIEEGIAALEEAVRLAPGDAETHHNLGVLHRRAGNPEAAVAAARRALELRPEEAESHRALALAHRLAGRHGAAAAALRAAQHHADEPAPFHTDLAVTLAMDGRLDEAAAELERALAADPSHVEAHYNLGLLETRRRRPREAAAAYARALELDPGHALADNNLGILRAGQGDLASAERHLLRATELDPGYAEAHLNLGVVYDQAGRPREAAAAVERALELRPEDPRIHLALGMLYLAAGRTDDSLPHFEAARRGGQTIPAEIAERLGLAPG